MSEDRPLSPATDGSDPWTQLRGFTTARIALGRSGGSQRVDTVLDFRASHARARDAVMAEFDVAALQASLAGSGFESAVVSTKATDRKTYLVRPDLGRALSAESRKFLTTQKEVWGKRDLVVVLSDGLSALAAQRHAADTLSLLAGQLAGMGWSMFPVIVAPFARVKLMDEIGSLLGARHALILLGERPGLGTPDSLGAYIVHDPGAARNDADRNCVSNIRIGGFAPAPAARKLAYLLGESARLGVSGVALKDNQGLEELPG